MVSMYKNMSKVLIVEDEAIFRSLFCDYVQSEFKWIDTIEACDGQQGWEQFRQHEPDYCIVDLSLPKLRGEVLINMMQSHHKPPRILILSAQATRDLPERISNAEQLLSVDKMAPLQNLNEALKHLFNGQHTDLGPLEISSKPTAPEDPFSDLTLREKTILGMIAEGKKSEAIGEMLGISVNTVRTHRRNLMQKLRIHSAALLVRYALEHGLVGETPNN